MAGSDCLLDIHYPVAFSTADLTGGYQVSPNSSPLEPFIIGEAMKVGDQKYGQSLASLHMYPIVTYAVIKVLKCNCTYLS